MAQYLHADRKDAADGSIPMLEKDFQKQVIELARRYGWKVQHSKTVQLASGRHMTPIDGDKGFPDLVLCHRSHGTVFAELKSMKGRFSTEQISWLTDLQLSGQRVYCWRPDDLQDIIQVLQGTPT